MVDFKSDRTIRCGERVVFVKLGAIGDAIQSAAAVKAYRHEYGIQHLTWVAGKAIAPLIERFEVADEIVTVDESKLLGGSAIERATVMLEAIFRLARLHRADRIVTAYSDRRYRWLTGLLSARTRLFFDPRARRPSPIHHRSRVFEYWKLLGGELHRLDIQAATQSLWTPALEASVVQSKVPTPDGPFVALVPGGAKNVLRSDSLRRWPLHFYAALAKRLLSSGLEVVLVGGPDDHWVQSAFDGTRVHDLIGKTSLIDTLRVFSQASAVVSHDCGPLHLAAMTTSPLVALFGPTPTNTFLALGRPDTIALHEGNRIACSPCYDGKNYAVCPSNRCLQAITVDHVIAGLSKLLSGRPHLSLIFDNQLGRC